MLAEIKKKELDEKLRADKLSNKMKEREKAYE
jgi:hypothetical protein